jgi:DNA repair protein RadA/Sms
VELPLSLALYSARTGVPLPEHTAVVGEVSLTGEIRPVPGLEKRFRACRDLGFTRLLGPADGAEKTADRALVTVGAVRDAVTAVYGGEGAAARRDAR